MVKGRRRRLKKAIRRAFEPIAKDIQSKATLWQLRRHGSLSLLPTEATILSQQAYEGLDLDRLTDYHVHVAGTGTASAGLYIHPGSRSVFDPRRHLRFQVFRRAYGVKGKVVSDAEFISRLIDRAELYPHSPIHGLLAFDRFYLPSGKPKISNTELYVSNGYVFQLAGQRPDLFFPVISVHPYRPDALEALERWSKAGGRLVKWLPNTMGIDPSNSVFVPFYKKMQELGLSLLTHGGTEHALDAVDSGQRYGNPQLLRKAMENGVKVIVAHCAAVGTLPDLDHPHKKETSCFTLFMRMMDEERWKGLLFGEISGIALVNRGPRPLKTLLERPDLHSRLVNGSDYPVPAVPVLMLTRPLVHWGFIDRDVKRGLDSIRAVNPLFFDLVLKRVVSHPTSGQRFSSAVFHEHPELPVRTKLEESERLSME